MVGGDSLDAPRSLGQDPENFHQRSRPGMSPPHERERVDPPSASVRSLVSKSPAPPVQSLAVPR